MFKHIDIHVYLGIQRAKNKQTSLPESDEMQEVQMHLSMEIRQQEPSGEPKSPA